MRNILVLLIISFAGGPVYSQESELSWLIGTWVFTGNGGTTYETWQVESDTVLVGKSEFVRRGKPPVLQETLRLVKRHGQWIYISTVEGQNQNKPVSFPAIFLKGQEFVCENPQHDFPQRIAYRRIRDELLASIEGRKNGTFRKANFDFVLAKE